MKHTTLKDVIATGSHDESYRAMNQPTHMQSECKLLKPVAYLEPNTDFGTSLLALESAASLKSSQATADCV